MGGVPETATEAAMLDRGKDGSRAGLGLQLTQEMVGAFIEAARGNGSGRDRLGYTAEQIKFAREWYELQGEDGVCKEASPDKDCGFESCRIVRRGLIPRRQGGTAPVYGAIDPVQRIDAVFPDNKIPQGSFNGPAGALRAGVFNEPLRPAELDGSMKKSEAFKISASVHDRICRWLNSRKAIAKFDGIRFSIFMLGADKLGVVRDVELMTPGQGGCHEYPEVPRDELTRAMNELIKRRFEPVGLGKLSTQNHGGRDGGWYEYGPPNFLNIAYSKEMVLVTKVISPGNLADPMDYQVVKDSKR